MKHRPYIRDLLIFDGMADEDKVVSPNMVESLGMVNDFFEKKDNPFGYKSFKHWLHATVDETFIEKHFSKTDLETQMFLNWKREFVTRLAEYREA
jgi:hypothetical protein